MKSKSNAFYCGEKMCRKTAWDTPEYLTQDDWDMLKALLPDIQHLNPAALWQTLWAPKNKEAAYAFFYRVIGWPEGWIYCQEFNYFKLTGARGIANSYEKLKAALDNRVTT